MWLSKNDIHLVMLFDLGLETLKEHSKNFIYAFIFVFYSLCAIKFEANFISYNRIVICHVMKSRCKNLWRALIVNDFHPHKGQCWIRTFKMKGAFKWKDKGCPPISSPHTILFNTLYILYTYTISLVYMIKKWGFHSSEDVKESGNHP